MLHGYGVLRLFFLGGWSVKEEIVKYVKKIGFAGDVMYVETDVVSFKYSPTKGFHVSPVHPNKYEDTIKFLKTRK